MSNLHPITLRCAKQVYNKLNLAYKIRLLSNTSDSLPVEIKKMQQLVELVDTSRLESTVKTFLQLSKSNKNLNDFILLLDEELKTISIQDDDDMFDDLDEQKLLEITQQTFKKRERMSIPSDEDLTKSKKIKLNPTSNAPVTCFSVDIRNTEAYNILCSPGGSSKVFDNVPWIILYEIARFVMAFNIKWNELPFDAFQMFLTVANADPSRLYDAMIKWNHETRLGLKLNGLVYTAMERCPENVWNHLKKTQKSTSFLSTVDSPTSPTPNPLFALKKDAMIHRMIHFSGILTYKSSDTDPTIVLRTPKIDASNRLFRKFGQDRFFELKLSTSTPSSLLRAQRHFFLRPFLFMQRTFKFLFVKDDTLILFATEGHKLDPISIQQVIDWHMPITENWSMEISKYASRMGLGYSSSIPTLCFKPEEIIYIDDIYSESGMNGDESACMTDGCGIISCSAMKQIMGCQATDELPCAIQGRIAGAKGIWIIDPDLDFTTGNYIKIRKSQNKFKTGLPQSDLSLDPHHYSFDLVKNSICVYPSNLNTQFIQCLAAGGVPTFVFIQILQEYIHKLATIVTENKSIKLLRDWVSKAGKVMNHRWEGESSAEKGIWRDTNTGLEFDDETDSGVFTMDSPNSEQYSEDSDYITSKDQNDSHEFLNNKNGTFQESDSNGIFRLNKYSGQPCSIHESIIRLLDAGFDLSNAYIANRITMVFRQIMQSITIKYKIEVPQSCTITCVPDPTGTLNPGEVFLQLSSRRKDEKTGVRVGQILGDIIVTRNPCGLRSDIQKVKAVDCTALRMYTDVIVFSVKGEVSLASKLSGGDYDGDIIFCCWDDRIVSHFTPSPLVPEPASVSNAFDKDKSTVGNEVGHYEDAEKAIQRCFISVALPDSTLGIYENWRTVLAEKVSLDHPDVHYLAHMCAKLVDAPKQGLRLKPSVKDADKAKFSDLAHPAWFVDKRISQRRKGANFQNDSNNVHELEDNECATTMDFLYATLLKETASFTKYSRSMFCDTDIANKDADLTEPWLKALELANQTNNHALKADLELIKTHIERNKNEYKTQYNEYVSKKQHHYGSLSNHSNTLNEAQFNSYFELEEYFAKEYLELPSISSFQSTVFQYDIQANDGKMLKNIKASYAYVSNVTNGKYSKYCYIVAYDSLRRIKADACAKRAKENGIAESVATSTYKSMNIDRGWLRKLKEARFNLNK